MASITVREVLPVLPRKEYTVTLNEREVDALVTLSGFIGGNPEKSPRGLVDGVLKALAKASGKTWMSAEAYEYVHEPKHRNGIRFDDYDYNE